MGSNRRWPSYSDLRAEVHILSAAFVGGHIQKVRDPDGRSISLKLRVPGQTYYLTLSGDPNEARVEVESGQPSTLPQPTGIGRWARAHLVGQRVTALTLDAYDRIITLMTPRGGICLELLPHAPNLYTLTDDGRVMGWSKRIPSRGLRLGKAWVPPERPESLILGADHGRESSAESTDTESTDAESTDAESTDAESTDAESTDAESTERDTAPLYTREDALETLRERLGRAPLEPEAEEERGGDQESRERRRLIKQTRARLKRLHATLSTDLERVAHAQRWREEGELLKSNLGQLKRGMESVTLTDWYDPNLAERTVELDPKLDGLENAERLFKKHRKAVRGAEITRERLTQVEEQQLVFEDAVERLSERPPEELRIVLIEAGIYKAKQQPKRDQNARERRPYRVFWSANGEKIWLGRGGMDNHLTSFQAARGQDLWVHTRDVPGAHVIVPLANRNHTPQRETILDAAALSVHHSKLRDEEDVALYFTERKHIRPVPGGPPGKVMVASSKTLIAEDVATRIERLYAEAKRREALTEES